MKYPRILVADGSATYKTQRNQPWTPFGGFAASTGNPVVDASLRQREDTTYIYLRFPSWGTSVPHWDLAYTTSEIIVYPLLAAFPFTHWSDLCNQNTDQYGIRFIKTKEEESCVIRVMLNDVPGIVFALKAYGSQAACLVDALITHSSLVRLVNKQQNTSIPLAVLQLPLKLDPPTYAIDDNQLSHPFYGLSHGHDITDNKPENHMYASSLYAPNTYHESIRQAISKLAQE